MRLKRDTPPLEPPSAGEIKAIGTFTRLTSRPVAKTEFADRGIDLTNPRPIEDDLLRPQRFSRNELDPQGEPYRFAVFAYRVRAVSAAGKESGPSPYILTISSAPQNLFSREDGETCHLKWNARSSGSCRASRGAVSIQRSGGGDFRASSVSLPSLRSSSRTYFW
ncbi:MAG: hypothetical protein WD066_01550 [Planctomycetaceae bacterium]